MSGGVSMSIGAWGERAGGSVSNEGQHRLASTSAMLMCVRIDLCACRGAHQMSKD